VQAVIWFRNHIIHLFYRFLLKPVFFRFDPEVVHDRMCSVGVFLGKSWFLKQLTGLFFSYSDCSLEQNVLGIKFKNPVGLAAGFDKDAVLCDVLPFIGFGFIEVGSITGEPCLGNPKPRLWRLKKSKSLLVYYGLKNEGCTLISQRLKDRKFLLPVGTNIAKTNSKATALTKSAIADYTKAFKKFVTIGDYFTINISCPNAYGGQPFTDTARLEKLLVEMDKIQTEKPIFLKLSPDLSTRGVDAILAVAKRHRIHGFICTNLTKNRKNEKIMERGFSEKGGLSGKVVEDLSNDMISYIYKKTKGKYVIIGLGGIFNAEDAYRKIKKGASLVQLITGMVFEGPQVISEINFGLVGLLKKDGFSSISQAIGKDNI